MRIEPRYQRQEEGAAPTLRGLVLIAECNAESELIDQCFGNKVLDGDGLIAKVTTEIQVRLADGYGEHYLYVVTPTPSQHCPETRQLSAAG